MSSIRRQLATFGSTVTILVFCFGPVIAAGRRGARLAGGLAPSHLDGLVLLWLLTGLAVGVGLLGRHNQPPRALPLIPIRAQAALRRVVDVSAFGAGSLRGWTLTNPEVGLDRVAIPTPANEHPAADPAAVSEEPSATGSVVAPVVDRGADRRSGEPTGHHRRARAHASPRRGAASHQGATRQSSTAEGATELDLQTMSLELRPIKRGETWWTLAEELLGDGRHWGELRRLNLGREVSPGTVVGEETILRAGWELLLPTSESSR